MKEKVNNRVSADVLLEIEKTLSTPLFMDIAVGESITTAISRLHTVGSWKRNQIVSALVSLPARRLLPKTGPNAESLAETQRRPILAMLSTAHPRYAELVMPIVKELDPSDCSLLACGSAETISVPVGVQMVPWNTVKGFNGKTWKSNYSNVKNAWTKKIKDLCVRHNLPAGTRTILELAMMFSSQRIAGAWRFLKKLRPDVVLTDYDRNPVGSCLTLVANKLNIRTCTLVHGVPNENAAGYVPLLSDRVFCWGESQKQQFVAEGVEPERVDIIGCSRMSNEHVMPKLEARKKIGLPKNDKIVVLASSSRAQLVEECRTFCQATEHLAVQPVVRMHPAERLKDFGVLPDEFPRVRFSNNSDASLNEILAATDVLVTSNSSAGSEAILKGIPVVVMLITGAMQGHGVVMVEEGGCPKATNASELRSIVESTVFDTDFRNAVLLKGESYSKRFCALVGQASAELAAARLMKLATAPE